jgi:hypothetical protein
VLIIPSSWGSQLDDDLHQHRAASGTCNPVNATDAGILSPKFHRSLLEFIKIPQTLNYSSNFGRFLIRILIPVKFRSNRSRLGTNLDAFARRRTVGRREIADGMQRRSGGGRCGQNLGAVAACAVGRLKKAGRKKRRGGKLARPDAVLLFVFAVYVPCDALSTRKMYLQVGFFESL